MHARTDEDLTAEELLKKVDDKIQQLISSDQTGFTQILFANAHFRARFLKSFREIYNQKKLWESDFAIFFLLKAIEEFRHRMNEALLLRPKAQADQSEFDEEIERLKHALTACEEAAYERELAVHGSASAYQIPEKYKKPEDLVHLIIQSLPDALQILNDPMLAAKIPMDSFTMIINAHRDKGIDISSEPHFESYFPDKHIYYVIRNLVAQEISARLNRSEHLDYGTLSIFANDFRRSNCTVSNNLDAAIEEKLEQPIYDAFCSIYSALYKGNSNPFKRNYLSRLDTSLSYHELLSAIEMSVLCDHDPTLIKAWRLAKQHYLNCNENNTKLVTEIYKTSFAESGIFKKSTITGIVFFKSSSLEKELSKDLTLEQIKHGAAKTNSRTAKIVTALSNCPKPF